MSTMQQQVSHKMMQSRELVLKQLTQQSAAWRVLAHQEAETWQAPARELTADLQTRAMTWLGRQSWQSVKALERRMLAGIHGALEAAASGVGEKVAALEGTPSDTTDEAGEAPVSEQAYAADGPPLDGYEEMTAKAIIAEMPELDGETCRAILEFEEANKARTTVLRAARDRVAA